MDEYKYGDWIFYDNKNAIYKFMCYEKDINKLLVQKYCISDWGLDINKSYVIISDNNLCIDKDIILNNLEFQVQQNQIKKKKLENTTIEDEYIEKENAIKTQIENAKNKLKSHDVSTTEGLDKMQNIIRSIKELEKALRRINKKENSQDRNIKEEIKIIDKEINKLNAIIKMVNKYIS